MEERRCAWKSTMPWVCDTGSKVGVQLVWIFFLSPILSFPPPVAAVPKTEMLYPSGEGRVRIVSAVLRKRIRRLQKSGIRSRVWHCHQFHPQSPRHHFAPALFYPSPLLFCLLLTGVGSANKRLGSHASQNGHSVDSRFATAKPASTVASSCVWQFNQD